MACSGLGWSWDDLAKAADVSRDTVARFLRGEALKDVTITDIERALEKGGVEFLGEDGVRIRRKGKR